MMDGAIDFASLMAAGHPVRHFKAGDIVFAKGDAGAKMYIVQSGSVALNVNGKVLETVGPNGTFGEMALIDGSARSATATAVEDSELAEVDRSAFVFLVHEHPYFALDVMSSLAERLRRMNDLV